MAMQKPRSTNKVGTAKSRMSQGHTKALNPVPLNPTADGKTDLKKSPKR